jgi:transcription antitermination factor NusG
MLHAVKGEKVEIVFGAFDAVDGEVVDVDEHWLKLRRKNRFVFVQIDKIIRLSCRAD